MTKRMSDEMFSEVAADLHRGKISARKLLEDEARRARENEARLEVELHEEKGAHASLLTKHRSLQGEWQALRNRLKSGEACQCCAEYDCDCMFGITWGDDGAPEGDVDRDTLAALRREGEELRQEIAKRVAPMKRGPWKPEGK